MFTRTRLVLQDKNIIKALKNSSYLKSFKPETLNEIDVDDLNHKEQWLVEIRKFIKTAEKKAKYREPFRMLGYNIDDMYRSYIYMTLSTMPNPILKTGKQDLTVSAIGSCMYQEDKQFSMFRELVRSNSLKEGSIQFADMLKAQHDFANGAIFFENVPY